MHNLNDINYINDLNEIKNDKNKTNKLNIVNNIFIANSTVTEMLNNFFDKDNDNKTITKNNNYTSNDSDYKNNYNEKFKLSIKDISKKIKFNTIQNRINITNNTYNKNKNFTNDTYENFTLKILNKFEENNNEQFHDKKNFIINNDLKEKNENENQNQNQNENEFDSLKRKNKQNFFHQEKKNEGISIKKINENSPIKKINKINSKSNYFETINYNTKNKEVTNFIELEEIQKFKDKDNNNNDNDSHNDNDKKDNNLKNNERSFKPENNITSILNCMNRRHKDFHFFLKNIQLCKELNKLYYSIKSIFDYKEDQVK
jgi:hypothetical protein